MRPSVAPYLTVSPALAAIAYYTTVFGAKQKAIDAGLRWAAHHALRAVDQRRLGHARRRLPGASAIPACRSRANSVTTSVSLEYPTAPGGRRRSSPRRRASAANRRRTRPSPSGARVLHLPRSVRPSLDPERDRFSGSRAAYSAAGGSGFLGLGGGLGFLLRRLARGLGGGQFHLLGDARRLAAAIAQIIELGAAHLAAADHLDRVDVRRIDREDALDALAVGNLADGEALVEAAAGPRDADAFIGLHAGALAFLDLDVDDDRVARLEFRDRLVRAWRPARPRVPR